MKILDLTKLSYQRLQNYRKSLRDKQHRYLFDGIGQDVSQELNRVLLECEQRNKSIINRQKKDKWATVPTHKELNKKLKYKIYGN